MTHGVPGIVEWWFWAPVLLVAVKLKRGLQEGTGDDEEMLRWDSPQVHERVSASGVRRGRSLMKIRQGSNVRVEESMVALSIDRSNLCSGLKTEGVKSVVAKVTRL